MWHTGKIVSQHSQDNLKKKKKSLFLETNDKELPMASLN